MSIKKIDCIESNSNDSIYTFNDSDLMSIDPNEKPISQKKDNVPLYCPMFSLERELLENENLIKRITNPSKMDYTMKASLLLKRVEMLKVKEIIDMLEVIKQQNKGAKL